MVRLTAGVIVLAACLSHAGKAADIVTAYAEDFPPYSFSRDGKATGISTDMLRQVCAEAKITCRIEIVPWARAYRSALTHANAMVFSTARTAEREKRFLWLGPIRTRKMYLYVLAGSSLTPESITKVAGLKLGVVNGDAASLEVKAAGLREPVLDEAPSVETNLHKLLAGRIDAVPSTELGMAASLKLAGLDAQSVRQVASYPASDLYYAINPDSDPDIVGALRNAWAVLNTAAWRAQIAAPYIEIYGPDAQVDR